MSDQFSGLDSVMDGWTSYQDPAGRFRLEHPTGWTVKSENDEVRAQSPDEASLVLAENFSAPAGEMALAVLARIPGTHASLFPGGRIDRIAPQNSAVDEAIAAITYHGPAGPSQARLLCRISQGQGALYAMAAPEAQFTMSQPALLRILHSLTFNPSPETGASALAPSAGPVTAAPAGPASNPAAPGTRYVQWTDPVERSFHVEVPEGWKVEGGAFRFGATDIRQAMQVLSPGEDMALLIGHPQLSNFTLPNPMLLQMGLREGQSFSQGTYQSMLFHYMPGLEFNRWFLGTHLSGGLDQIAIRKEEERPEISRQQSETATKNAGGVVQVSANCGITEFSAVSKHTGKPIVGILQSTTFHYPPAPMGGIWFGSPVCRLFNADEHAETSRAATEEILHHIIAHWQADPEWTQRTNQEQAQITSQTINASRQAMDANMKSIQDAGRRAIEAAGARARMQAQANEERRATSMQAHWDRMGVREDMHRKQMNYIADRTDVRDPNTGQAWSVPSGSNNYYLHPCTDTIVGTDSPTDPGVDFTRLKDF